jgi:D-amino peptidase
MKIRTLCDIEGVSAIVDRLQVNSKGGEEYERGCRLMMAEVNAAIHGALNVGPADFVVNDVHGNLCNLIPNELHRRARLIQRQLKPLYMAEGLEASFDACFVIW